jgi:hypothetical protein
MRIRECDHVIYGYEPKKYPLGCHSTYLYRPAAGLSACACACARAPACASVSLSRPISPFYNCLTELDLGTGEGIEAALS